MATTTFESWYDDVMPYVPGCNVQVAKQKIRAAAIEFCKLSRSWRYRALIAIDALANQQSYVIATPVDTVIAHIFQVNYNGEPITFATPAQFRAQSDTWFSETGDPEVFTLFTEGEISLSPIPSTALVGAIVVPEVALAPSQVAAGVDSSIFERYREVVALGARGLLYQMPKKPYTDMNLGMAMHQEFLAAAGAAGARASTGRGQARLRSKTIIR